MKTILLHVHEDAGQESRFQAAFDLARATGAHISCIQVTPFQDYVASDMFGGAYVLPAEIEIIREQEEKERTAVEARMGREGLPWDWRHIDGDVVRSLLSASRLADVIIVSLPEAGGRKEDGPLPIVAELAVNSRCPVLAVPQDLKAFSPGGRALVAWDGSPEASAAVRAATPLLQGASQVHIVTVEEEGKRSFPAIDASAYLSRHGIASELHEWPKKQRSVEEALADAANELAVDWIVMGAFGHSRLRETIFGGVTRFLLTAARVPLLLAH
jgi:nucleotide-binding universal stress UspA family protein